MYSARITIFDKDLKPIVVDAQGSRTALVDVFNKILKDNENANNIQILVRKDERTSGK